MPSRISQLATSVKENPDDSFYKFALALELLKVDDQEKALKLFQNIRNNDPGYVGVYYHLAKLYTELGENKKAIATYKEGIEVAESQQDWHSKSELASALYDLEYEMGS